MEQFKKILIETYDKKLLKSLKEFLNTQNLKLEKDLDYRMAFVKEDKIIGSGCFKKNILKCIALDDNYKGQGISNLILSDLINEEYRIGNSNIFVFTKPKNLKIFEKYGFYKITEALGKIVFLENHNCGLENYFENFFKGEEVLLKYKINNVIFLNSLEALISFKKEILKVKNECDCLHIFIFSKNFLKEEDNKCFKEKNIFIHKDFNYLISYELFSKYFLNEEDIATSYSLINVKIIGCIIKNLKISKAFILEDEIFKILINEETKEFLKDNNFNLEKH